MPPTDTDSNEVQRVGYLRFNLADLACEEALYDSASLRRFVGIDLGREPVPDATTMLKFRRLLNDNKLGEALIRQGCRWNRHRGASTLMTSEP